MRKGNVGEFNYLTQISPSGDSRNDNYSRHVYVFNNIFYDDQGTMCPYGWATGGSYYLQDFETGNNNYYNEGQPCLLDATGFANPNTEAGATIGDPHLTLGTTPSTWQGWVNYFRPLWDSQSTAMLVDKGSTTAGNFPYPAVVRDIEGNPRPRGSGWDIGPYEYQSGAYVTPAAHFSANPPQGVAPALIDFTDCSSGGPTAWSWTFGDGGSSTVQNPSHTYSSTGLYTVSLKATNSAGNNTSTVSNFVTIAPYLLPVATFEYAELPSGTGALGAVPFTVSFTNPPYGHVQLARTGAHCVMELRRRWDEHRAESQPHLHHDRNLLGDSDRHAELRPLRQRDLYDAQLHHGLQRGDRLSGQLLHPLERLRRVRELPPHLRRSV